MPELNAIGIAVSDMAASIRFYRLLGLDVPETPDEDHVDAFLPNGVRFMLDSEDVMRSFREDWMRQTGNQISFALECGSPAEVDEVYARVTAGGLPGREGAVGRLLGPALRAAARPGRGRGQPLRAARDRLASSTSVRSYSGAKRPSGERQVVLGARDHDELDVVCRAPPARPGRSTRRAGHESSSP